MQRGLDGHSVPIVVCSIGNVCLEEQLLRNFTEELLKRDAFLWACFSAPGALICGLTVVEFELF